MSNVEKFHGTIKKGPSAVEVLETVVKVATVVAGVGGLILSSIKNKTTEK